MSKKIILSVLTLALSVASVYASIDSETKDAVLKIVKEKNYNFNDEELRELIHIAKNINELKSVSSSERKVFRKDPFTMYSAIFDNAFGDKSIEDMVAIAAQVKKERDADVAYLNEATKSLEKADAIAKKYSKVEADASDIAENIDRLGYIQKYNYEYIGDFISDKLGELQISLTQDPADPSVITFTFTNNSKNYEYEQALFNVYFVQEGKKVPLYEKTKISYPFASLIVPGQSYSEQISCSKDCQEALKTDNVKAEFQVNEIHARVINTRHIISFRRFSQYEESELAKARKRNAEILQKINDASKVFIKDVNSL